MNSRRVPGILAALFAAAACTSTHGPKAESFAAPEQVVDALVAALRANDRAKAAAILGEGADEVLTSGDEVADRNNVEAFLAAYDEKHQLATNADGSRSLTVGATDWPMPIPLVAANGSWSFDTAAGLDELLSRRIGRNELDVVQVLLAIVDAQREYASADHDGDGLQEYAEKILSDDGKQNGLYWPTKPGEEESPLGPLVADAEQQGYGSSRSSSGARKPFHGYHFKLLRAQGSDAEGGAYEYAVNGQMIGGFAVVAWPADYANSGIMTFMVNHAGVVFQKDLGEESPLKASAYTTFSPGAGWNKVQ